jgi:chromosome segregation protein
VETLKLAQARERFRERQAQIDEQPGRAGRRGRERKRAPVHRRRGDRCAARAARELQAVMEAARGAVRAGERALRDEREQVTGANANCAKPSSRSASVATSCRNWQWPAARWRAAAGTHREELRAARRMPRPAGRRSGAEACRSALDHRVAREHALARARDALEAATNGLRALDEQRLKSRAESRPAAQSDRRTETQGAGGGLNVEQAAAQLAEAKADEPSLAGELAGARGAFAGGDYRAAALDRRTRRGQPGGARRTGSGARTQGLPRRAVGRPDEAMETLENAIRRIDRETRDLLQSTYDAVNRSFGELFPALFGGGEARLIMTGEEILDAGLQVMAQPPGKKNSTIHLLSGGEKALTAIALVFSMFQLNPAPFCLLDEVDAPLDDTNTERFCSMVRRMSINTQFLFISHNKITMEMAQQLVGVTMQESGVSRIVEVDMEEALRMREQLV